MSLGLSTAGLLPLPLSAVGARAGARQLSLHEYQAKNLMDRYNMPTQLAYTASSASEAEKYAKEMKAAGVETIVLKSQVFAGGRGKGTLSSGLKGGVQFAKDAATAGRLAQRMINYKLVTKQTPPEGLMVRKLLLAEGVDIRDEFYLAVILDRDMGGPCLVVSREGGVEIEQVAETNPEAVHVIPVNIKRGIEEHHLKKVCEVLFPAPKSMGSGETEEEKKMRCHMRKQLKECVTSLYRLFIERDASQIEINPLAVTTDNRVLCVDAKLNFDDNASFRQKQLFAEEDTADKDAREMDAAEMGMNFISMDGSIGNLVNGAGLAMATMDLIAFNGGSPANFLDLGGGATKEQVLRSFELLTRDPNTKAIFVNIFGGITRCDVVAQGILDAAKQAQIRIPLVVRLVGNAADAAKKLLHEAKHNLTIHFEEDLNKASIAAVNAAKC